MKYFPFVLIITSCLPPSGPLDTADCGDACARMKLLGCEEANTLSDGTTCKKFCEETQNSGHALRPSCIAKIEVCSEIDLCQL